MIEKSELSLRVVVIDTLPIKRGLLYNPCLAGIAELNVGDVGPDDLSRAPEYVHL
jgi:hypothetical protein